MDYARPVWAEINLQAIRDNVKTLKSLTKPGTLFMAVVKANGYGHGAKQVARAAVEGGADRLGVALVEEAVELREAGFRVPIHILSEIPPEAAPLVISNDFIPTVCTRPVAEALSRVAQKSNRKAKIHLKVDTGMNRLGLFPAEVPSFIEFVNKLPNLEIEGIFTHFALADKPENEYTLRQLRKFQDLLLILQKKGVNIRLKHAANSAATVFFPETHFDMIRIGITLYGLHPSAATKGKINLKPALQLKARVSYVKKIKAGEGVSYGFTYRSPVATTIVTLPLGYGDGYSRLLSNKSQVLLEGQRMPVVGQICMDQLMVDAGPLEGVAPGSEAVLIGRQGNEEISVDELADILGTINYEVVCMINSRVPRVYVNDDRGQKTED